MAGCQMFRLSCLQHILMWIYWWMRRKFLIKSTVQNETQVSFDEVLNNIALRRVEVQFLLQLCKCFWSALLWNRCFGLTCEWHCGQCNVLFLIYPTLMNIAVLLLLTRFWLDSSKQNLSFVLSCTLRLHAFEVGWSLLCTDGTGRTPEPQMASLLSVSPRNRITVSVGKEKHEINKIQQHEQEWKQQEQGSTGMSKIK